MLENIFAENNDLGHTNSDSLLLISKVTKFIVLMVSFFLGGKLNTM